MFAAGIVTAVCLIGTRVFGRRAGVLGAASLRARRAVLTTPRRPTRMPYFWFAVALVVLQPPRSPAPARLRRLRGGRHALECAQRTRHARLFLLMPVPIVERLWREHRAAAPRGRRSRALTDRRLADLRPAWPRSCSARATTCCSTSTGFAHVAFSSGRAAPSIDVRADAHRLVAPGARTAWLMQQSLGWPFLIVACAGLLMALARRSTRLESVWLLTPVVSYYLSFITVILHTLRPLRPANVFRAGRVRGCSLRPVLSAGARSRTWRMAVVAAMFATPCSTRAPWTSSRSATRGIGAALAGRSRAAHRRRGVHVRSESAQSGAVPSRQHRPPG